MSKKLFDFCVGNPPYQTSGTTNNKAEAVYHHFYNAAEQVSDKYILISPARFLFNAGLTPKDWNKRMLNDEHLKVEKYYSDSGDVFANANINGGVAIVYRDSEQSFGAIEYYIPNDILRGISRRFPKNETNSLATIVFGGRSELKFNNVFLSEYPDTYEYILKTLQAKHPEIKKLGPNEEYEVKSSSFERTPYAFTEKEPSNTNLYYKMLGIEKGKRVYKWVLRKYLSPRYPNNNNIDKYKIMMSNADGAAGQIGKPIPARILGKPIVAEPYTTSVPTFMSIGKFDSIEEARNLEKYVQTRFVRVLVGLVKITQHITPSSWSHVPLQDFTSNSDIDWSKSVHEIDLQLYRKYGLSVEEIDFIETHVKEMI